MKFLLKHEDQWQILPPTGMLLPAGIHTIAIQSPQPHFTITAHIRHYEGPRNDNARERRQLWSQDRAVRTNEEGLGLILLDMALSPGSWEVRCTDADLIAELFGEGIADTLQFTVVPLTLNDRSPRPAQYEVPPSPVAEPLPPTTNRAVPLDMSGIDFQILPNRLTAAAGNKAFLAGRTNCSGLVVVIVTTPQGAPLIQLRQPVKLRTGAQSAAFTLPLFVPDNASGTLHGQVILFDSQDQPLAESQFQLVVDTPTAPIQAVTPRPEPTAPELSVPELSVPEQPPLLAALPMIATLCLDAPPSQTLSKLQRFANIATLPARPVVPEPEPEPEPLKEAPKLMLQVPEFITSGVSVPISVNLATDLPPCAVCLTLFAGDRLLDGPRWLVQWDNQAGSLSSKTRIIIPKHQGRLSLEAFAIPWDQLRVDLGAEPTPIAAAIHEWDLA